MEPLLDAKSYRRISLFYENELLTLEDDKAELNHLFLPVINQLHYFSRPSHEARVIENQLALLKQQIIESIAILNTLALIAQVKEEGKDRLPVYPLLEEQLKLQVKNFIIFFEDRKSQSSESEDDKKEK